MFGMEGSDGFEKDISQALEGGRVLQKGLSVMETPPCAGLVTGFSPLWLWA